MTGGRGMIGFHPARLLVLAVLALVAAALANDCAEFFAVFASATALVAADAAELALIL